MPSEIFGKVIEKFQICERHYFDPVHSIKLLSTFIPLSQNDLKITSSQIFYLKKNDYLSSHRMIFFIENKN